MKVNPIIVKEFVETAKVIKEQQASLMKQIIRLGVLFDMSITSLSENLSGLSQDGQVESEKCLSLKKSIEGINISVEKLQKLKKKVKQLDPNQESLVNIKVRVS